MFSVVCLVILIAKPMPRIIALVPLDGCESSVASVGAQSLAWGEFTCSLLLPSERQRQQLLHTPRRSLSKVDELKISHHQLPGRHREVIPNFDVQQTSRLTIVSAAYPRPTYQARYPGVGRRDEVRATREQTCSKQSHSAGCLLPEVRSEKFLLTFS